MGVKSVELPFQSNGGMLLAATAIAFLMAQGRSQEELAQIAAFFDVLGDALALLSLDAPEGGEG